ncbi:MAG: anaerobic ribonucleoside-triphosphate reductase activating protein [Lachnospiraceae bacterium]
MQIHGFAKTTLLDYPKHVASTVFTGSCNFRCPFCQNGDLVLHPTDVPLIPEEDVLQTLEKRRSIIEGVCITGGEPTLQADLKDFILKIRDMGFLVKLDTNGYRSEVLEELLDEHLLDYVAMDIKNCPEKYAMSCGIAHPDITNINRSIELLLQKTIPFEFRTTVVRQLHTKEDFVEIGKWIQGADAYFLQSYQDSERVISPGFTAYSKEELQEIQQCLLPYVPAVELRGVDG